MLTPRETEVAEMVCRFLPAKRISALLGISVHTVEVHIENAAKKLPNPEGLPARAAILAASRQRVA